MHTRSSDLTEPNLAQKHDVSTLAGAVTCRLVFDGREEDAMELARLFRRAAIRPPKASSVDTSTNLAAAYNAGALAGALVRRLSLDGRTHDAQGFAVLFMATNIGTAGDFGNILPRA